LRLSVFLLKIRRRLLSRTKFCVFWKVGRDKDSGKIPNPTSRDLQQKHGFGRVFAGVPWSLDQHFMHEIPLLCYLYFFRWDCFYDLWIQIYLRCLLGL